jgi:hypothetical protein
MVSSHDFGTAHLKRKVVTRKFDQLVAQCFNIHSIHLLHVSAITSWWWNLCVFDCCTESVQRQIWKFVNFKELYKQTNINFILQGFDSCLNRNKYFLLHLHDNTLPMFMSLDVRDFNISWSPILMPLFHPFVTGSDESGWDRVVGKPAFSTLPLLRRSLAAQLTFRRRNFLLNFSTSCI